MATCPHSSLPLAHFFANSLQDSSKSINAFLTTISSNVIIIVFEVPFHSSSDGSRIRHLGICNSLPTLLTTLHSHMICSISALHMQSQTLMTSTLPRNNAPTPLPLSFSLQLFYSPHQTAHTGPSATYYHGRRKNSV